MGTLRPYRYRLVLVDDHPIVRNGLSGLLGHYPEFEVCGEASGVDEAMRLVRAEQPDGIVVDIFLGKESGMDLIGRARQESPRIGILALSMLDEMVYAQRALRRGANGYVMKQEATHLLVDALRTVLQGRTFVSPAVADRVLSRMSQPAGPQSPFDSLTDRELEVLRLVALGQTQSEIGQQLQISPKTVESHRSRIKEKLGLGSATELLIFAVGWLRDGGAGGS